MMIQTYVPSQLILARASYLGDGTETSQLYRGWFSSVCANRCTLSSFTIIIRHDRGEIKRRRLYLLSEARRLRPQLPKRQAVIKRFYNQKNSIKIFGPSHDLHPKPHNQQSHTLTAIPTRQSIYSINKDTSTVASEECIFFIRQVNYIYRSD